MTINLDDKQRKVVAEMQARLVAALGDKLVSLVLYGTATQGERAGEHELSLLVVLADLELATLSRLGDPFAFWRKKRMPVPRILSPALLERSRDVFPIELMDLTVHREILFGADPTVGLEVDDEHLRIQCERDLSEKLMRLREAFAECQGRDQDLAHLMTHSFPAFTQVLRGAVRLVGQPVPDRGVDVARAFCRAAGLDDAALVSVDALRQDGRRRDGAAELFARYYATLEQAADFIDRHVVTTAATTPKGATS